MCIRDSNETLQNVGSLLCLAFVEYGTTDDNVVAMLHKTLNDVLEVEQLRSSVDKSNVVDTKTGLKLCVFEEVVEHHIGDAVFADLDNDANTILVRLILNVGYAIDFLCGYKFGNLLDDVGLDHHVRNLLNHNALAIVDGLDVIF